MCEQIGLASLGKDENGNDILTTDIGQFSNENYTPNRGVYAQIAEETSVD